MKFLCRIVLLLFIASPICNLASNAYALDFAGKEQILNLSEAVGYAVKYDAKMREALKKIQQKKIGLTQARHAVTSQHEKDQSLFSHDHSLSNDLDLRLKVPQAQKALFQAEEELRNKERQLQYDVESLYLKAATSSYQMVRIQNKRNQLSKRLKETKMKYTYRLAAKEDVVNAQKLVDKAESDLKLAQLSYQNQKVELGDKIGLNLETGYKFGVINEYAILNQDMLWKLIQTAEKSDFDLYQDKENRKIIEDKVNITRDLYKNKFGSSDMSIIESMYSSMNMDYEQYVIEYESFLDKVKKSWEGFLFLGIIPLPKFMIQGEFDGLRYFEDVKYSLPVSLFELDQAKVTEKETIKATILKVKQAYLNAKTAEETYAQSLKSLEAAQADFAAAQTERKFGLMTAEELSDKEEILEDLKSSATTNQFTYKAVLAKLNLDSSGGLAPFLKSGPLPWRKVVGGLELLNNPPPASDKAISGKWTVASKVEGFTSEFSIHVDKSLGATQYCLVTLDGSPVGSAAPLNEKNLQLSIVFNSLMKMKVLLYKGKTHIATALLEGNGSTGTMNITMINAKNEVPLKLVRQDPANGNLLIGTYLINKNMLTPNNYKAALATISTSGQSIYYKSEFADGAWFNIENAVDIGSIAQSTSPTIIKESMMDGFLVSVTINDAGFISSNLTPAEQQQERENLVAQQAKLKEHYDSAVADNDLNKAVELYASIIDVEAQIAFLDALKNGDQKLATAELAKINNPQAVISALEQNTMDIASAIKTEKVKKEEAELILQKSKLQEALKEAQESGISQKEQDLLTQINALDVKIKKLTEVPDPEPETVKPDLNVELSLLKEKKSEYQQEIDKAIINKDFAIITKILIKKIDVEQQIQHIETGLTEHINAIQTAKVKLEKALNLAVSSGDLATVNELTPILENTKTNLSKVEKERLFENIDVIIEIQSQLEALDSIQPLFSLQIKNTLQKIKENGKKKYTAEELAEIKRGSEAIKKVKGVKALPVESIISREFDLKFDVPPVIIGGRAFLQIRPISEALGALVVWDAQEETVTISKDDIIIVCKIGSLFAYLNGNKVKMDVAPRIIQQRTVVPLRFVIESLGLDVVWNEKSETIEIDTP